MSRIVVLYDLIEPPVEITKLFFQRFSDIYKCDVSYIKSADLRAKDIESCEVLILIRSQSMYLAYVAETVKKSGRIVISMYDDDFLAIRDYHIRRRIQEKAVIKTLRNTSVLFSTNINLLKKYGDIGNIDRRLKTDTGVGLDEVKEPVPYEKSKNGDLTKVLYYCNDGTTENFDKVIGTNIIAIIKELGDIIDWSFIGTKPVIDECVSRDHVHYIEHLTLDGFRDQLRNGGYAFGIAPLLASEFSGHKYINKFIEFTTAGIPCVYSNVAPYSDFIIDKEDGLLCDNTAKGWIDAFEYMINEGNRWNTILGAQRRIKKEFSIEALSKKMVDVVPEMIDDSQCKEFGAVGDGALFWIKMKSLLYAVVDPFSKAVGRARIEGIRSLLQYSFVRLFKHEIS